METALFEYGLIWEERETEFHFIFGVGVNDSGEYTSFEWGDITKDIDFEKEYDWVKWEDVLSYTGMDEADFFQMPIPNIISDLLSYYGYEEIFGTAYYPFEIKSED